MGKVRGGLSYANVVASLATGFTAAVVLALSAAGAYAGPPGTWSQITGQGQDDANTMRTGLARTLDGVLHVLWTRSGTGNAGSVLHSAISADARQVSGPNVVFTGKDGVNRSVDLVRAPDGTLRAFFAATNEFKDAMASATSTDGVAWAVQGPASNDGPAGKPVYAASGIGAAVGKDGTFFSIWGDSAPGAAGYHVGLDPKAPDGSLPGGTKTDPGIGVDSQTGQAVAAWNSLDGEEVVVMPLAPGATPTSIPTSAPMTQHRVGITGRIGAAGVFVAYAQGTNPFLADPAVYRVGGRSTRITSRDGELVSIAAAPSGRLWVFWKNGATIHATRSNPAATRWGRIVGVRAPGGTDTIYDLNGEGSLGPLDLLAHVDPPTGTLATFHQRILPGLFFTTKRVNGKTQVKVTDAGDRVSGARVRVSGAGTKTTKRAGTVVFSLRRGSYTVRATKAGYASYSRRVRVR